MACGALQRSAGPVAMLTRLGQARAIQRFLFPVQALSRVFRGKFLHALEQATPPARCRATRPPRHARRQRLQALRRHDWVVYAKTPLAGPAAVLDYLSRYTHRTAIGNERLVAIAGDKVLLRVRADATGGKRTIALDGQEFIARFLQHVLPRGFKRIRHYGLLAPATKADRLATGAKLAGHASTQPAGPRGRAGLHATRGRRRDHLLPALQTRPLAACAASPTRPRRTHQDRAKRCRMPRTAMTERLSSAPRADAPPSASMGRHSSVAATGLSAAGKSPPRRPTCAAAALDTSPHRAQDAGLTGVPLRASGAETYTPLSTV